MANDVFLNGVPHSVQTSELTKNAVNPRNTFIDTQKNELDAISDQFATQDAECIKAPEAEVESKQTEKVKTSYPTLKDSFAADEFLAVSKKHISNHFQTLSSEGSVDRENFYESLHNVEDRIQRLRNKHPSKNIQHIGRNNLRDSLQNSGEPQRFDDNMQMLDQKRFTENRQLVDEGTVGDNFQKLSPTQSRRDNILYKEKKNIQANFQKAESLGLNRAHAVLGRSLHQDETPALGPNEGQNPIQSASKRQPVEDELTARVRKMKKEIGKVNQSLTDFEGEK